MAEGLEDGAEWGTLSIRIPPELRGYEPEMAKFLDAMVFKLRRNAHKGKWERVPMVLALERLDDEMGELRSAVVNGSTMEILMEAADVANTALIVANISLEVRETAKWMATKRHEGWAIGKMAPFGVDLWADQDGSVRYYPQMVDAITWANHLNGQG